MTAFSISHEPFLQAVGPFAAHLDATYVRDGEAVVDHFQLVSSLGTPQERNREEVQVHYPLLRTGDVIPVQGDLFRVTSVEVEGQAVAFERVGEKDPLRNLAPPAEAFGCPLLGSGRIALVWIFVKEIRKTDPAVPGGRTKWQARVKLQLLRREGLPTEHDLSVGDPIEIKGTRYFATRIVPQDEARKVIGWVEFSRNAPKAER